MVRHSLFPDASHMNEQANRLADLLFSGLEERPSWSSFLTTLARETGTSYAYLVIEGNDGSPQNTAVLSPDPRLSDEIGARLDRPALHAMPEGVPTERGLRISLGAKTGGQSDSERAAWLLIDSAPTDATAFATLLTAILPLLERMLPLYELIGKAERHRLVAEYVLETSGVGVVLVERDGTIASANDRASALMQRTGLMAVRTGRLIATDLTENRRLIDAIAHMSQLQGAQPDPAHYTSFALSDPIEGQRLTLIVRPGPPYGPVSAPLKRTAVVIMRDPTRPTSLSARDLEQLFALTPAEARLASQLASGAGLEEAAVALGVSRNTARSQLQAIYGKTGVNRQGDLVRLLLSSAATHAQGSGDK